MAMRLHLHKDMRRAKLVHGGLPCVGALVDACMGVCSHYQVWQVCVCMYGGTYDYVYHLNAGEGLHVCAGEWGEVIWETCWCVRAYYVQAFM